MNPEKRLRILSSLNPDDLQPVNYYELELLKALKRGIKKVPDRYALGPFILYIYILLIKK